MSKGPAGYDWSEARGERWAAQVAGMEAMLRPVDEPLIEALRLDAPHRIAEVGCGGGGTAREVARRAPKGSVVHGYDISPALVAVARERADRPELAFELADMGTAALPGAPYDRLYSRFGIMFFADPPSAFANLAKWIAPGGGFAFAVWGPPAENPWIAAVRETVAEHAELPESDPEGPGPFRYCQHDKLLGLLSEVGFGGLEARNWRGELPLGGGLPAAEAASFALTSFSAFAQALANAGGDAHARAHRSLADRFAGHERDGAVHMDACICIFTGTRG